MKKLWKYNTRTKVAPYIFILPFFIVFAVFMAYPIVFSFIISFTKWNGVGEMEYVGLANFIKLFKDPVFSQSLLNSVILFFLYVPVMLLGALVLANLLNQKTIKGKGFFRASLFLPNVTSIVAVAGLFLLMFDTKYGILNSLLGVFNIEPVSWFGTPMGARIAVSSLVLFRWLGYNMIIMLSGLQNISKNYYEAARIDGASNVQIFFKITVQLMRPIILFCVVLSTIGTFSLFTEPLVLTNGTGGPMNTTMTPVLYIYKQAFGNLRMGYASSAAFIFFILMAVLTLLQFRMNKRFER